MESLNERTFSHHLEKSTKSDAKQKNESVFIKLPLSGAPTSLFIVGRFIIERRALLVFTFPWWATWKHFSSALHQTQRSLFLWWKMRLPTGGPSKQLVAASRRLMMRRLAIRMKMNNNKRMRTSWFRQVTY